MSSGLRIAIDGPSGAGKSTLARALARHLGLPYVDTGAMYRAIGWLAMQRQADSEEQVVALLEQVELQMRTEPDDFRILVDGVEVTELIRDPAVSKRASEVAQIPAVREWLVRQQRESARGGAVVEGRDIGSAVLPDADAKVFITAPEEVRMRRRAQQLDQASAAQIEADIRDRDRRDRQRRTSPLRVPDGALVIDTGGEDEETSLGRILEALESARGAAQESR